MLGCLRPDIELGFESTKGQGRDAERSLFDYFQFLIIRDRILKYIFMEIGITVTVFP